MFRKTEDVTSDSGPCHNDWRLYVCQRIGARYDGTTVLRTSCENTFNSFQFRLILNVSDSTDWPEHKIMSVSFLVTWNLCKLESINEPWTRSQSMVDNNSYSRYFSLLCKRQKLFECEFGLVSVILFIHVIVCNPRSYLHLYFTLTRQLRSLYYLFQSLSCDLL